MLHRLFGYRPTWLWISIITKSHLKSSLNFSNLHKHVIQHYWHLVSSNNKCWLKCIHFFFRIEPMKKQRSSAIWLETDGNNKIFHFLRNLEEKERKNRQRWKKTRIRRNRQMKCIYYAENTQISSWSNNHLMASSVQAHRLHHAKSNMIHSTFLQENLNRWSFKLRIPMHRLFKTEEKMLGLALLKIINSPHFKLKKLKRNECEKSFFYQSFL